jgi:hypothetical protein
LIGSGRLCWLVELRPSDSERTFSLHSLIAFVVHLACLCVAVGARQPTSNQPSNHADLAAVYCSLAASCTAAAVVYCCRRHQVTIFVEPKVFQELVDAGRVIPLSPSQQQLQQQQQQHSKPPLSGGGISSSSSSSKAAADGGGSSIAHTSSSGSLAGMLISTAQAPPQQSGLFPVNSWAGPGSSGSSGGGSAATAGAVVGAGGAAAGVIKTWQPELHVDQQDDSSSSMVTVSDLIPEGVTQQLDLVVVLGGDGTVLWTCHIFGNRWVQG